MVLPTTALDKDRNNHKAKVHLSLFGFKHQQIIPLQKIVETIDALPDFHLEGLDEIQYDPDRVFQSLLSKLFNRPHINRFQAEYIQSLRCIFIYELKSTDTFFHVMLHEIGHHVYFHVISSQLKRMWVKDIRPNDDCITPYAKRNACEDFAECYATYQLEPNRLKLLPQKYDFMHKQVFFHLSPTKRQREYRF